MQKKLISLISVLLVGCGAFGLSACGGKENAAPEVSSYERVDAATFEQAVHNIVLKDNYTINAFSEYFGVVYEVGLWEIDGNNYHTIQTTQDSSGASVNSGKCIQYEEYDFFSATTTAGSSAQYGCNIYKRNYKTKPADWNIIKGNNWENWNGITSTASYKTQDEYTTAKNYKRIPIVFLTYDFKISAADTQTHKLYELADQFTCDEENIYTATLYYMPTSPITAEIELNLAFSNNNLVLCEYSGDNLNMKMHERFVFSKHDATTVPSEAELFNK